MAALRLRLVIGAIFVAREALFATGDGRAMGIVTLGALAVLFDLVRAFARLTGVAALALGRSEAMWLVTVFTLVVALRGRHFFFVALHAAAPPELGRRGGRLVRRVTELALMLAAGGGGVLIFVTLAAGFDREHVVLLVALVAFLVVGGFFRPLLGDFGLVGVTAAALIGCEFGGAVGFVARAAARMLGVAGRRLELDLLMA